MVVANAGALFSSFPSFSFFLIIHVRNWNIVIQRSQRDACTKHALWSLSCTFAITYKDRWRSTGKPAMIPILRARFAIMLENDRKYDCRVTWDGWRVARRKRYDRIGSNGTEWKILRFRPVLQYFFFHSLFPSFRLPRWILETSGRLFFQLANMFSQV